MKKTIGNDLWEEIVGTYHLEIETDSQTQTAHHHRPHDVRLNRTQTHHNYAKPVHSQTSCPEIKQLWKFALTTDEHPAETTWELRNGKGTVVASNDPHYEPFTQYEDTACLKPGVFTFVIRDAGDDGLCCQFGEGGFVMTVEGEVVREMSGEYAFTAEEFSFEVVDKRSSSNETSLVTNSTAETQQQQLGTPAYNDTTQNWTYFDYSHTKFCGPKIVGGYDIAISRCSPSTICGLSVTADHYGSNGNDCPDGLMCYADITCRNGPGESMISSLMDTHTNSTHGGGKLIVSEVKNTMTMTNRGSYCGASFHEALSECSPETYCSTDDDCKSGACHSGISCIYSDENDNKSHDSKSPDQNKTQEDGVVVSSMLEDTSSGIRFEIRLQYYLAALGLGIGGVFFL